MLHSDLCRDAHLTRAAAQQFRQTGRRHRAGDPHFTLAADFGAGDGGVHLIQRTNRAGDQHIAGQGVAVHLADKLVVVGQHRRHDTAGAVGWRGHHPAAGGVLFVHRQGEHIDPVDHRHRIAVGGVLAHQHTAQRGGAARDAQFARQDAFGGDAALDTGAHHFPHRGEVLLKGFFAVQRQFVLHHQAGERQPGFTAVTLQVGGVFVRVRNGNRRLGSLAEVLLINDKAAADRVIRLAVEHLVAGQGGDTHAVLMQRQVVGMEIHALIHREVHFVLTVGQHQAAMGINVLNKARNGVDVDGVRQVAGESHDNRDIGMVAFTGQGEGAEDVDDDFAHLGQQAARDQVVSELFARFHRSNGMGAGRANADFKDIEYADHMYSRAVGKRAAVKRRGGRR